jgi:uncharacterized protein (DUF362 family)
MEPITTHEQFMLAVQNHLKEREGCPVMVIVHSPTGLEMQFNFMDYALQMGILDVAKMSTMIAFERQTREGLKTGENQIMVSNIKDAIDSEKKKVN